MTTPADELPDVGCPGIVPLTACPPPPPAP